MKTVAAMLLLSFLLVAPAPCEQPAKKPTPPKTRVAVVNVQRVISGGINYEKIRLLSLDKTTVEALKKINKEIQEVQAQIVDVNDETTLAEMGRRLSFLNQKNALLRQRAMGGDYNRDVQALIRKFVVEKYKDKYALIVQQQDSGYGDRILFKAPNVEVEDITDEVRDEFQKHLDQVAGGPVRPARHGRIAAKPLLVSR